MEPDEPQALKSQEIVVGGDLSNLSIDELQVRIAALRDEIARHEAAVAGKQSSLNAAEGFFKST